MPYIHGDLSDSSIKTKVLNDLQDKDLTLLAGGPPCQGFSIFGKRRFVNTKNYDPTKDPRNKLALLFWLRKGITAEWFVMENVIGFYHW